MIYGIIQTLIVVVFVYLVLVGHRTIHDVVVTSYVIPASGLLHQRGLMSSPHSV